MPRRFPTRFSSGCGSISCRRRSLNSPASSASGNSTTPYTTACTFPSNRRCFAIPDMSISRLARAGRRAKRDRTTAYILPPTVSRPALLEKGSDRPFRTLVNDLFRIATRMEIVRARLGVAIGVSGPQYNVLIAIAHLEGEAGVRVGTLAGAMHVSSAFIASETGKVARLGLLLKRPNPHDRRGVLLTLTPAGGHEIDRLSVEIRAINDLFFGALEAKSFTALCAAAQALVKGSAKAMHCVNTVEHESLSTLKAAE